MARRREGVGVGVGVGVGGGVGVGVGVGEGVGVGVGEEHTLFSRQAWKPDCGLDLTVRFACFTAPLQPGSSMAFMLPPTEPAHDSKKYVWWPGESMMSPGWSWLLLIVVQ